MSRELEKWHNEEMHSCYPFPNIMKLIKPRRVGWEGHVASMVEVRKAYSTSLFNV
jgi:hypothetical protein